SPASAVVLPGGSTRRARRSSESSASPWANGGIRDADSVNDGTRLKWLICLGPTPPSTLARAPSCTSCSPCPRRYIPDMSLGVPDQLWEQLADELLDAVLAFGPLFEDDADERPVDPAGESADDREVALDPRGLADDLLDLPHVAVRVFER